MSAAESLVAKELDWAPTVERPDVDDAFVQRSLASWPTLQGRAWQRLGGGLRSVNVRVGDVVARIGVGDEHALDVERALLTEIDGVRVPRVVGGGEQVVLLEYVAHTWPLATAEVGARTGAAAAIHSRRFPTAGFLDASLQVARPMASALDGLRGWVAPMLAGRAGQRLGGFAEAAREAWSAEEAAMAAATSVPTLVHGDFKPMNIGWLAEEGDVVVFDWEFAWAGPPLLDLGQLLRWNPPPAFVTGVERGYREAGGTLPSRWRRLAELFDLFNLVAFLDGPRACERRIADVMERVRQTLASV